MNSLNVTQTGENDAKGAFANFLVDSEVTADNRIRATRGLGVLRR